MTWRAISARLYCVGKFDMTALLFGGMATSFRRCADYMGPVKIVAEAAHGRGVVTTQAVKAGDLLLVASPLAVAPLASGCEMALCQGLMGTASRNPQDLSLITALPVGDANTNVPDASKFRRHLSKGDEPLPPLPPQEVR